jgi:hypothetical protein
MVVVWNEPASIRYQRRTRADPVLEVTGMRRGGNTREFIVVCGMGGKTIFIRWYGVSVEDVRQSFRQWLAQPWQTLTTDFTGVGVPNGLDFKPGRIDWFNIAD